MLKSTFRDRFGCVSRSKLLHANRTKPLNIQIITESVRAERDVIETLRKIVKCDRYVITPYTAAAAATASAASEQSLCSLWQQNCILLMIVGNLKTSLCPIVSDFVRNGGFVFGICSDFLTRLCSFWLPVETSELNVSQLSYKNWSLAQLEPDVNVYKHGESVDCTCSIQRLDASVTSTPPILFAQEYGRGLIVHSQVHLERCTEQSHGLEIVRDILEERFAFDVSRTDDVQATDSNVCYLIGNVDEFVERIRPFVTSDGVFKNSKLEFKMAKSMDEDARAAARPLILGGVPDTFSVQTYFDILKTECVGRTLLFAETITSTLDVTANDAVPLPHGFVAIAGRQTDGRGRGTNQWLSPRGSASLSLRLLVDRTRSVLGTRLSLLQSISAVAVVHALRSQPHLANLDFVIKWPNDLYTRRNEKIGGIYAQVSLGNSCASCTIGIGANVANELPTVSINTLIKRADKLATELTLEHFYASVLNQLEWLLNEVETSGNFDTFYDLYYKYWSHENQSITILDRMQTKRNGRIIGIDNYGFLRVQLDGTMEVTTVQPDGNSFDMLENMIIPKQ